MRRSTLLAPWLLWAACSSSTSSTVVPDAPMATAPDAPLASPADAPLASPADAPPAPPDAPPDAPPASPPDALPSPITGSSDIPLSGVPYAMAENPTTQRLYVSLIVPPAQGFAGAGVAVIDESNDSLVTTIPAPKVNSLFQAFQSVAVDEAADKVYLASNTVQSLYVIDGATNAFTATPIALPAPQFGSSYAAAVAVDSAAGRLYVWLAVTSGGGHTQNVTVYDTATMDVVTSVPLDGIAEGTDMRLAVDPTNHLLFACGDPTFTPDGTAGAVFATIDTMTNAQKGTLQSILAASDGYLVDCKGGAGFASLLTNGNGSSGAVLHELEPASVVLPDDFVPDTYDEEIDKDFGSRYVYIFGHDAGTGQAEFVELLMHGETIEHEFPAWGLDQLGRSNRIYRSSVKKVTGDVGKRAYVAQRGVDSPFTPQSSVTVFVIDPYKQ